MSARQSIGYMAFMMNVNCFINIGKRRYNIKLWKLFIDCFNCLPVAALIDDRILCMHGGLSPELESIDQIKKIEKPTDVPDTGIFLLT